jgi:hypothetical protein
VDCAGINAIHPKKRAVKIIDEININFPFLNLSAKAPKDGLAISPTKGKIAYLNKSYIKLIIYE